MAAICILTATTTACTRRQPEALQATFGQGKWNTEVHAALDSLISQNAGKGHYAVFDFDKTTITHDISNALMTYQIEHLRFASAPDSAFLCGIHDAKKPLEGIGISAAEMGTVLQREYESMKARLAAGESLEQVWQSDEYLDFRARFVSFLDALDRTFPESVWYAWMPGLLSGFTEQEAKAVVSEALDDQLGEEKLRVEEWVSPDGRWGGKVEKGVFLPQETKDLYRALSEHGIDAYVCSASLELIVEALACDTLRGLGLDAERVYGLRFVPAAHVTATYDPTYPQPMLAGKVDCIKACIAPRYDGQGPVLVGGDSNGDVPMLTAFDDMQRGLIIDVGRSPETPIGKLATKARQAQNKGRYLLQPAFAKAQGGTQGGGI